MSLILGTVVKVGNAMKCINRYAFIVRPKKPFLNWVNFNDPEHPMTLVEIREEPDVYLLPEIEDPGEQQKYLEENCDEIFRHLTRPLKLKPTESKISRVLMSHIRRNTRLGKI